jgi:5-(carboxyamino)imidazole ribonucleotide mutase
MGSSSDAEAVRPAAEALSRFNVPHSTHIISAHRTPDRAAEFARTASANGYGVLICAAGKAAHLAGVVAAYTILPVIGLPIRSSLMDGLDSLLSIVQMPTGVPVATVAVNGAENAALLAVQILALREPALSERLAEHKRALALAIEAAEPPF